MNETQTNENQPTRPNNWNRTRLMANELLIGIRVTSPVADDVTAALMMNRCNTEPTQR